MITIRIRSAFWFASGVAVALLVVAVFVGIRARAAVGANETTFVPISPCRLFDTRPGEFNVGPRSTPIGPKESHVQQVTGSNGQCVVPSDATGVALNVTAVAPSAASFLTLYPADVAVPNASNLNFVAGGNPTPNKVDVKLSPTGTIGVYNSAGTVHVLADVVGYYTPKGLADLQAQIGTKANAADVYTKAQVDALLAAKANKLSGVSSILISASAFASATNFAESVYYEPAYDSWLTFQGSSRCLVAPVLLPDGVTVTSVDATFEADNIAATATVRLLTESNGFSTDMANLSWTPLVGRATVTDSTIVTPVVNARVNANALYVCLGGTGAIWFEDVEVHFTYPA